MKSLGTPSLLEAPLNPYLLTRNHLTPDTLKGRENFQHLENLDYGIFPDHITDFKVRGLGTTIRFDASSNHN